MQGRKTSGEILNKLREYYPDKGKMWCILNLGLKETTVRTLAAKLGLRLNTQSEFYRKGVEKHAERLRGRKRPEHSLFMKKIYAEKAKTFISKKEIFICQSCNKTFFAYPKLNRKFCSQVCSEKWHSGEKHHRWGKPIGRIRGFKHSPETLEKIRISANTEKRKLISRENIKKSHTPDSILKGIKTRRANGYYQPHNTYSHCKRGKREDLNNIFFRSAWEANYARYLNFLIKQEQITKWEYEPEVFWFNNIKRGARSYTPDFKVINNNGTIEWHEVKGYYNPKSMTRLKRMRKYYPNEKIILIAEKEYKEIKSKLSKLIVGWE